MQERQLLIIANRAASMGRASRWLLHEIRNPVQVLSLVPELLDDPESQGEIPGMLREGSARLGQAFDLLEALLRWPPLEPELQPLALHPPLDFIQRLFAFHRAPTRLEVVLPAGMPAVRGLEAWVVHLLLNLVHNALAAQSGHTDGWIRIEATAATGGVALVVSDGGPGVAPAMMPRLFEPAASTRVGGTTVQGLGLYVARELARAMGGDLAWLSGSTFRLDLAAWRAGA